MMVLGLQRAPSVRLIVRDTNRPPTSGVRLETILETQLWAVSSKDNKFVNVRARSNFRAHFNASVPRRIAVIYITTVFVL